MPTTTRIVTVNPSGGADFKSIRDAMNSAQSGDVIMLSGAEFRLLRVFLVHHMTWSINSMCHLWGTRSFATSDDSRNNWVCAVFTLGEGWHNNHHTFPSSARHGLRHGQFDATYRVICALAACGLAWEVKRPRLAEHQDAPSNELAA